MPGRTVVIAPKPARIVAPPTLRPLTDALIALAEATGQAATLREARRLLASDSDEPRDLLHEALALLADGLIRQERDALRDAIDRFASARRATGRYDDALQAMALLAEAEAWDALSKTGHRDAARAARQRRALARGLASP